MKVNSNVPSIFATNRLNKVTRDGESLSRQLSGGDRIYQAAEDPAGLAISETLKSRIRSYRQARRNAENGEDLVNIAEGALSSLSNIGVRLRELAMSSATDTLNDSDRRNIQLEVGALVKEVDRIAKTSKFGDLNLLDGSLSKLDLQVGIHNNARTDRLSVKTDVLNATSKSFGISGLSVGDKLQAQQSLNKIDTFIQDINRKRANIGSMNRSILAARTNLSITDENTSAGNSRIRDTDYAEKSAEAVKNRILTESATASLANANNLTRSVMKLVE